ncbi:MAG: aminotransferase class V-fold PLP-dependent enzyme [Gemmatimonadetes bacterium]|nr:aminotransferase class V-fold PLP-dependent enzyme [Candidatus Palauibacter australiensis]
MAKHDIPAARGSASAAAAGSASPAAARSASPGAAAAVAESALPLDDRIDELRGQFPILSRKTYLNSNSLGALSLRSVEERRRFEDLWHEMGAAAWYEIWVAKLEEVRTQFGHTIEADADTIALMSSVSAAVSVVWGAIAASVRGTGRNKVVLTELDFPTVGHHFLSQRANGLEVEIVPSPDGIHVPLESIRAAVDERTALLATSHVFFTSGNTQDAAELTRIAHGAGSFILLDAYQSNGQLTIDAGALGVDFLVGGALKWLCGGPGMAYLHVNPGVCVDPVTLSWFGVENQFLFNIRDATPRADARRFELGTPAAGVAYTAAGGLSTVLEYGIQAIQHRNRFLANDLRERLSDLGYRLHQASDPAARSALVLVEYDGDAAAAVRHLAARDVVVDHRGPLVRFSPHFYNTLEDNERAVAALAET